MMMDSRTVFTDTSVLINLLHLDRLDLFGKLADYDFAVPEEVTAEVTHTAEAAALRDALDASHLHESRIVELEALSLFDTLRKEKLGSGEAACLALAVTEGGLVACDEKRRFRRNAYDLLSAGRLMTTPGVLILAIEQKLLSVSEADAAKEKLERNCFKMDFNSFREFIETSRR